MFVDVELSLLAQQQGELSNQIEHHVNTASASQGNADDVDANDNKKANSDCLIA
jgi:hypothetical protein